VSDELKSLRKSLEYAKGYVAYLERKIEKEVFKIKGRVCQFCFGREKVIATDGTKVYDRPCPICTKSVYTE
jgi:hypothetical protein